MSHVSADNFNQAIETYQDQWAALVDQAENQELFEELRPTALGWKVADLSEHDLLLNAWRDQSDQIDTKWLNGRWITVINLREGVELAWGIRVIKIMQRRPGSSDQIGLDHLDFYGRGVEAAKSRLLTAEPNLRVTEERNGLCDWLSIWFDGTEAKLRTGTTLAVCSAELLEADRAITGFIDKS